MGVATMEKDFKDDIKLITFCRKAIHECDNCNTDASVEAMSTDYFDIIIKQDFNANSELIDITKSNIKQLENINNIAMHSYPIYCSKDDIIRYAKSKRYSDPFDKSDKMLFFSIIQVHITPEVMGRLTDEHTPYEYMELFSNDIHKVIDAFAQNSPRCNFKYRVYRSLSAGDFIVVIRSEKEDTSFRISTLLRRRTARNDNNKSTRQLVMYKTYTVLSIYNTIIETVNELKGRRTKTKSCFAIRCCFSNKYWRDKQINDKKFKSCKKEIDKNIFRLNGRYDISVLLTRDEFMNLFPLFANYKGLKIDVSDLIDQAKNWDPQNEGFSKEKYLGYMLCNGYFAYVNERYLINFDEPDCLYINDIDNDIVIYAMSESEPFLEQKNNSLYEILYSQFLNIDKIIKNIKGYRKNIAYYMSLIGRLIMLCKTINVLSDMRIYSYILMNQLGIILNGIKYYLEILIKENSNSDYNMCSIMDNLEEYLRKSVHALDSYACYIRNNNLQFLQTPNYNLEGNFSVEKYLICYSEFLKEIIEQYNKISVAMGIGALRQKLVPVFEPDSLHDAISISILFREREEKELGSTDRSIMLVRCSTFKEIINIPEITTAIFHETAHQFRYEPRKKRNDVLLKCCVSSCFNGIVSRLIENAKLDLPWLDPDEETVNMIKSKLVKAYLEIVCESKENPKYDYEQKPLYIFKRRFMDELNSIYDKTKLITHLRQIIASTIESAKFNVDIFNENARKAIIKIVSLEENILTLGKIKDEKKRSDAFKKIINDAKKATNTLCKYDDKFDKVKEQLEGFNRNIEKICSLFITHTTMENIWENAYDALTKEWSDSPDKYDSAIGRYLGLDYNHEDSKAEFVKQMNNVFNMAHDKIFDDIEEEIAQYREITADMFMCKLLELDIFGYLDFIMRDTPVDTVISDKYIIRFIYVLYAVFDIHGNYRSLKGLKKKIDNGVRALNTACEAKLGKLFWERKFENSRISILSKECQRVASQLFGLNEDYDDIAKEYLHFDKMYLLLNQLKIYYKLGIKKLCPNEVLKNDLKEGNAFLGNIRENFPNDIIRGYCDKFASFWNDSDIRYGVNSQKIEDLNNTIIDFIQRMYYNNKFRNAQECYNWGK